MEIWRRPKIKHEHVSPSAYNISCSQNHQKVSSWEVAQTGY